MTYTQVPPLTCNILGLDLTEGKLTGPSFLRFVQTPQPRLKRLYLNSVTGLANKDLLAFLSIIASTLEELQILSPSLSSLQLMTQEEYAIDLVMPRLVSLQKIVLLGDYLTGKAIAGRMSEEHVRARLAFGNAPGLDPRSLAEALQAGHCRWESIEVYTSLPRGTFQLALETAKKRGIDFQCHSSHSTFRLYSF